MNYLERLEQFALVESIICENDDEIQVRMRALSQEREETVFIGIFTIKEVELPYFFHLLEKEDESFDPIAYQVKSNEIYAIAKRNYEMRLVDDRDDYKEWPFIGSPPYWVCDASTYYGLGRTCDFDNVRVAFHNELVDIDKVLSPQEPALLVECDRVDDECDGVIGQLVDSADIPADSLTAFLLAKEWGGSGCSITKAADLNNVCGLFRYYHTYAVWMLPDCSALPDVVGLLQDRSSDLFQWMFVHNNRPILKEWVAVIDYDRCLDNDEAAALQWLKEYFKLS